MNISAYKYIDEHLISPSLICPICLDILEEPHIHAPCDSAFCRSCLLQLSDPLCPICRMTWNDSVPLQYNIDLPKANRLIRNMLDDLRVRCIHCGTILRRGQLEHECRPVQQQATKYSNEVSLIKLLSDMISNLSILGTVIFFILIYRYRMYLFEEAVDRRNELINNMAYNIDEFLLEKVFYLMNIITEYSMLVIMFNLCLWFYMMFYGERVISEANSRVLKAVLEISIIITLISYSLSN